MICINTHKKIFITAYSLSYLYGLFWLVTGLLISIDNKEYTNYTKLVLKSEPNLYIFISFSTLNMLTSVIGCQSISIMDQSDKCVKKYATYILIAIALYNNTMGSIYFTWMIVLFQSILYIFVIYSMYKLYENSNETLPMNVIRQSSSNNTHRRSFNDNQNSCDQNNKENGAEIPLGMIISDCKHISVPI